MEEIMKLMNQLKKFLLIFLFIFNVQAQDKPLITSYGDIPPKSIAFIGSSLFYYNNGISNLISSMVKEGIPNQKLRATMLTIGGSGLDWHDVESYFRPNGVGTYSITQRNEVVFNDPNEKIFEAAVMMDCSQCPIHPQLKSIFFEYAKKHSETVRKHGATPVFFMTWAYQDKPEMTASLSQAYIQASNENNALLIPAGLAFAKSSTLRPDLNLYAPDHRHPSLAGSYLAAATVYTTLFNANPIGLKFTGGLSPEVALHLQKIAFETTKEFFNQQKNFVANTLNLK